MSLRCWTNGTNQCMSFLRCYAGLWLVLDLCRYLTRVWTIYVTSTKLVTAQPCYCLILLWTSGAVQSRRAWNWSQVYLAFRVKQVIYTCIGAKPRLRQKEPCTSWCWKGRSLRTCRRKGCQTNYQVNCRVQPCQPHYHATNDSMDGECVSTACIPTQCQQHASQ